MTAPRRRTVAFVTTTDLASIHDDLDRPVHDRAFAATGIDLVHAAWEDEWIDWAAFDLVVVRSPWNYVERLAQFRAWLDARRSLRTFHNPVPLIEWNLDKRYLSELAARGVAVVPTRFVATPDELAGAFTAVGTAEVIVKPGVSAGSRLTGRFSRGSSAASDLSLRILAAGLEVMVQPGVESVATMGEVGTVCFDGVISHSFRKGPILGPEGALRGGEYREEITPVELDAAERDLIRDAQEAVHAIAHERGWLAPDARLLYARYDIVTMDDGSPALLEAELFEPSFFLAADPTAADRFLDAVRSLLDISPSEGSAQRGS